ncbi:MAG: C1 family peptidase [Bacilli bacterium]|nr:C1 family peptidase [Bacilli bacterium]
MKTVKIEEFQVDSKRLSQFNKKYNKDPRSVLLRHALNKNSISDVVYDSKNEADTNYDFSIEVKTLPACNQKQSGRCWIFAACNVLRESLAKQINIENIEISQNYIAFFDKLEKANFLLTSIVDLAKEKPDSRVLMHLLVNGVSDGGQWDMFVNIVRKYGIVPKNNMKETKQSSATYESNVMINSLCRQFAAEIQKVIDINDIAELKNQYLQKIYNLLCDSFGVPPTKFDFEYTDKDGKYHLEEGYTPKSFFDKYVGESIDDFVSIINSPTEDKPFYKIYTIDYLNNVVEGKPITHLNLPMDRVKELIIEQLKNNEVVWFGSDVSNYRDRATGLWDDLSYDYVSAFDFDLKFNKSDMLDYHDSCMNHAMVITGVNIKNGKPNRWKIENSWGTESGNKGYYMMSSSWFDSYVYQAVINKKYLNDAEKKALKGKLVLLDPWDPMGTLAD